MGSKLARPARINNAGGERFMTTSNDTSQSGLREVSAGELRALALWSRLGPDHLDRVTRIVRRREVAGGVMLFREGEPADTFYLVVEGRVSLSLRVPGREDAIVATLSSDELLGWSALLPPEPAEERTAPRIWTASARTLAPTSLLVIPGKDLVETCELNHEIGYYVMLNALSVVAGRLRDTRLQLLDMFGTP
jgi:CRP/FNR family cyclic AMP-dependent transcriptional regulator